MHRSHVRQVSSKEGAEDEEKKRLNLSKTCSNEQFTLWTGAGSKNVQ